MQLKVIVTGRNRKIASDITEHMEKDRGYLVVKCKASKEALFEMVPLEMPNVVIICLGDETSDTVTVFDVLRECANTPWITILVIANNEDQKLFINNTRLKKMFFLSRPVSLIALYAKLTEVEKKVEEDITNGTLSAMEFINPNVDDGPLFKRKRILVVDDDPEQLTQIKSHLEEFYDVGVVRSGDAAFKYLERHDVDLMLLDYIMPRMDGPEVFTHIRMDARYSDLPVIFLTGVTEKDKVIKTLVELKPQGYIVKPSKKSELVAKIIDVLG